MGDGKSGLQLRSLVRKSGELVLQVGEEVFHDYLKSRAQANVRRAYEAQIGEPIKATENPSRVISPRRRSAR